MVETIELIDNKVSHKQAIFGEKIASTSYERGQDNEGSSRFINKVIFDLKNIDVKTEEDNRTFMFLSSLENLANTMLFWREALSLEELKTSFNSKELKKKVTNSKKMVERVLLLMENWKRENPKVRTNHIPN